MSYSRFRTDAILSSEALDRAEEWIASFSDGWRLWLLQNCDHPVGNLSVAHMTEKVCHEFFIRPSDSLWLRTTVVRRLTLKIADFYVTMLGEKNDFLRRQGQRLVEKLEMYAGYDMGYITHECILTIQDPIWTPLHAIHLRLIARFYRPSTNGHELPESI